MSKMSKKIIGITGNIASGKSCVSNFLIENGYKVIDTDLITNEVYQNNLYFKEKLVDLLGSGILVDDRIDKKKVSALVFNDLELLNELNLLIHPIIREETIRQIDSSDYLAFVDVPLMYEVNFDELVDDVILIVVDKDIQVKRLVARNGMSINEAKKRINSQMSQDIKMEKARYIVDNNQGFEVLYKQIREILDEIERGM